MHTRLELRLWIIVLTLCVVAAAARPSLAQTGGGYDLVWSAIAGGSGTASGGTYQLGGTVGQPAAGSLSGGGYALNGGFWGGVDTLQHVYLPIVLR